MERLEERKTKRQKIIHPRGVEHADPRLSWQRNITSTNEPDWSTGHVQTCMSLEQTLR